MVARVNALATAVASFLYTGFFPLAPATFATAVFLAAYWLVPGGEWLAHGWVLLATAAASIPTAARVERARGKDPSCVVIDEVVGIQVVLVGAQPTPAGLVAAFLLFRAFDIAKPFPIDRSQRLPGGWGIVADDVLAGLYARVVLALVSTQAGGLGRFLG